MTRVLFVDDDPPVLESLRDALRPRRREWDMSFRVGGHAALDALADGAFDIVVSDIEMPVLDGAALLRRVRDLQPAAVRVVMSGSVELGAVDAALVAHRMLPKPSDIGQLTRIIERASELSTLSRRDPVRRLAHGVSMLPVAPGIRSQLAAALREPSCTTRDVASVIRRDVALTAKVLQLANSDFFGRPEWTTSVEQAATRLPLPILAAVGAFADSQASWPAIEDVSPETLARHSRLVSTIARELLPAGSAADDAATAGLVHDVGLLVLATQAPNLLHDALVVANRDRRPLADVERDQHGITHADLGAHLLTLWGLPDSLVEAVANHHRPPPSLEGQPDSRAAVAIAEVLAHRHPPANTPVRPWLVSDFAPDYLERLGIADRTSRWQELAAEL